MPEDSLDQLYNMLEQNSHLTEHEIRQLLRDFARRLSDIETVLHRIDLTGSSEKIN